MYFLRKYKQYNKKNIMKKELGLLQKYLECICEHWKEPKYITLSVLVQNMAFKNELTPTAIKSIYAMREIEPNCHITEYVIQQLDMIRMAGHYDDDFEG